MYLCFGDFDASLYIPVFLFVAFLCYTCNISLHEVLSNKNCKMSGIFSCLLKNEIGLMILTPDFAVFQILGAVISSRLFHYWNS